MKSFSVFLLLLNVFSDVCADFKLTLLHTNDVHGRIEPTCTNRTERAVCYGGVSRRMTIIRSVRNSTDNVLLLDAGDQFQGTSWFLVYKGDEAAHFMQKLGYDVMTLGNHEFDHGPGQLARFLQNVTFPVVSANVVASREPLLDGLYTKSTVIQKGGKKIGIIGYTFSDTPLISSPGENVTFMDEVIAVKAEADLMKRQGVDILIGLGHSGFEVDKQVAAQVDDIDIVVGGHTNTFLYSGDSPSDEVPVSVYPHVVTQASGKRVPIVHDYAYGKYIGVFNAVFDDDDRLISWSGNPVLLDDSVKSDPMIQAEVNEWRKALQTFSQEEVGTTNVYLDGDRKSCRFRECNLGNLITDAMVAASLRKDTGSGWAPAPIAVWNGGGIRNSIPRGRMRQHEVLSVLPFSNEITMVKLNGSDLKAVLEHSVADYGSGYISGRFLQMSGIHVKYNIKRPSGERVVKALVRCGRCDVPVYEPLNDTAVYDVLVSYYLRHGGDAYRVLKEKAMNEIYIGTLAADAMAEYVRRVSPVIQGVEGRITLTEEEPPTTGPPCNNGPVGDAVTVRPLSHLTVLAYSILVYYVCFRMT